MLYRWPSWAPKGEYLHVEKMKLISPLIPKFGFPALFKAVNGTVYVPIIHNAKPIPGSKWPLIVFSHGMGCARFTYSQICYDLASHGFILAAVEHRFVHKLKLSQALPVSSVHFGPFLRCKLLPFRLAQHFL